MIAAARVDATAFTRLYQQYVRPVYRYLYSRVGQVETAEDLTAQVFLEALESLPRYRHNGYFGAWLFGISRNKAADYFRRKRPEWPLEIAADRASDAYDPLQALIFSEEIRQLMLHVRQLDDKEQELLRLRFVAELSYREIAMLLNRNTEAVKKQVQRLLARLQNELEASHG